MFVPRLSSQLFGGDAETAVIMAVRKLGYIEPTLEESEVLQEIVRVNWEIIRLCYEAGYQSSGPLSARIVCAYTRNIYCACNYFTRDPDLKIYPGNQENHSNVTRPSSLRLRWVGSGDEPNHARPPQGRLVRNHTHAHYL